VVETAGAASLDGGTWDDNTGAVSLTGAEGGGVEDVVGTASVELAALSIGETNVLVGSGVSEDDVSGFPLEVELSGTKGVVDEATSLEVVVTAGSPEGVGEVEGSATLKDGPLVSELVTVGVPGASVCVEAPGKMVSVSEIVIGAPRSVEVEEATEDTGVGKPSAPVVVVGKVAGASDADVDDAPEVNGS
jgi:hypothetical protein